MAIHAISLINLFGGKVSHRYTGEGEDAGSGIDLRGLGGGGADGAGVVRLSYKSGMKGSTDV